MGAEITSAKDYKFVGEHLKNLANRILEKDFKMPEQDLEADAFWQNTVNNEG